MEASKIFFFVLALATSGFCTLNDNAKNNGLPKCGPGENYLTKTNSCVDKITSGSRPFCKNVTVFKDLEFRNKDDVVTCIPFTAQFMRCQRWLFGPDEYKIQNQSLSLYIPSEERTYKIDEYDLMNGEDGLDAIICINEKSVATTKELSVTLIIYSTGWIISIVALIAAFIICTAIPGFTTYRAIMPIFVSNLLISYLILVIRGLGPSPTTNLCYGYGVVLQFSFLAAFFWLNVIAFDIWRSVTAPVLNPGRLRLLAYMIYGWGCPLTLACAAVAIDKMGNLNIPLVFRPKFERDCWFHSSQAQIVYFFGPMSLILVINFVFFILTLFSVRSKVAAKEVENNSSFWRLSIELAVIMGLCWTMEVVSWAVGGDPRYWYATDVINSLQGLFVFIVIVRGSNVKSRLRKYFKNKKYCVNDEERTISYVQTEKKI